MIPRYTRPEMGAVWSDQARFAAIEAKLTADPHCDLQTVDFIPFLNAELAKGK